MRRPRRLEGTSSTLTPRPRAAAVVPKPNLAPRVARGTAAAARPRDDARGHTMPWPRFPADELTEARTSLELEAARRPRGTRGSEEAGTTLSETADVTPLPRATAAPRHGARREY